MKKLAEVHIRVISDFHPQIQKSEFKVPEGVILTFRSSWDVGGESIRNKGLLREVTEEAMYNGLYLDNSVEHVTFAPSRKIDLVKTLAPGKHMKKVVASYAPCADLPNWCYKGKQSSTEYECSRDFINLNQDSLENRFAYLQAVRLTKGEQDDIYIPSLRDRWISLVGENYIPFDTVERELVTAKASALIGDKIRICREELKLEQESRQKRSEELAG